MDYIREFDILLAKEMYYAGEVLSGVVKLETIENFKLRAIRVNLRGKAHTEWKVIISGDRRNLSDDQYFIDDRSVIWGKEKAEGSVPILPRGTHQFPFRFQLPETSLPCSFESKCGTIRYYLKVTIDIPYASPPQGIKYFTIIGPHIDCMEDTYLKPIRGECKRKICCLCCERRIVSLTTQLDRSAYCCGESLRVKADIDNQSEEEARFKLKLVQHVEYFIDRGVLGVEKEVTHTILEYRSAPVKPHSRTKWDSKQSLVVSTMPPTLVGICRLVQIYYVLKANLEFEKSGEDLHMHFPITIGTVPFRIPNSKQKPKIQYDVASDHVEGGMYIPPEFQLGQVYDGTVEFPDSIVLYRPVYTTVVPLTSVSSEPEASGSNLGSIKSKSQRTSVQKHPPSGSSQSKSGDGTIKEKETKASRPSRTSSSSAKSKIKKLNSLSVAPPSLQTIAKKRSSLPETLRGHTFDFQKPLMKLESIDISKRRGSKNNDNAVRFKEDVEPCSSKQILKELEIVTSLKQSSAKDEDEDNRQVNQPEAQNTKDESKVAANVIEDTNATNDTTNESKSSP